MAFGQNSPIEDAPKDGRGLITPEAAEIIRNSRVGEQWERIDSVCVGPGMRDLDPGWFNNWAQFAAAEELVWFSRRQANVGRSYVNQDTERTDWAQDIHQTGIEFIAPPGMADRETEEVDGEFTPMMFTRWLPTLMPMNIQLADTDSISMAPANHMPSGYGTDGTFAAGAAAPLVIGGNQGRPTVSNSWKWPEPLMLPAQGKLTVRARIDQPLRGFLANLQGPGSKIVLDANQVERLLPNIYTIKIFHRGPRFLQFRGARTAAG